MPRPNPTYQHPSVEDDFVDVGSDFEADTPAGTTTGGGSPCTTESETGIATPTSTVAQSGIDSLPQNDFGGLTLRNLCKQYNTLLAPTTQYVTSMRETQIRIKELSDAWMNTSSGDFVRQWNDMKEATRLIGTLLDEFRTDAGLYVESQPNFQRVKDTMRQIEELGGKPQQRYDITEERARFLQLKEEADTFARTIENVLRQHQTVYDDPSILTSSSGRASGQHRRHH